MIHFNLHNLIMNNMEKKIQIKSDEKDRIINQVKAGMGNDVAVKAAVVVEDLQG